MSPPDPLARDMSVPVGGRIAMRAENWTEITQDRWVLDIIKHGHLLEFIEFPKFQGVRRTPISTDPVKA